MYKCLFPILFIICFQLKGQNSITKPQFKLAGIDSGVVSINTILADPVLRINNPALKLISYDVYIVVQDENVFKVWLNKGDSLDISIIYLLKELSIKGKKAKITLGNVKTQRVNKSILILNNPLKLKLVP